MQKIKRIGACVLGSVMAGASLLAPALAADLSDYPKPFVDDGVTDFLIVIGANADPADVVGAINLAVRLGGERTETKTVETGGTTGFTVSNGISLDLPGEKIYLNDSISSVKDVLTGSDLSFLGKDSFEDDDGTTHEYTQYIELGSSAVVRFEQEDTDEDPIIEIGGFGYGSSDSNNPLYIVKIDFSEAVAFNDTDIEGNKITLLGREFTIASETDHDTLVLYKSAQEITLNKDEETTVTIGGTEYTIKVVGFDTSNDEVVLTVNGETNSIKESNSRKIGGLQIYAKSVTAWNQGNEGVAILQVGSEKVTLEDDSPVMVGDDNTEIDGTYVDFTASDNSKPVATLSGIAIYVKAEDSESDYLESGSTFTDPVFGTFKLAFNGITPELKDTTRDEIKFRVSGNYKGYVSFKDANGEEGTIYFAYGSSSADNTISLKDDSQKNIYLVEGTYAAKDEIIFLSPGADKERYTHIVSVYRIREHSSEGYAQFKDVVTGTIYKTEEGEFDSDNDQLKLIVDGKTYNVTLDATNNKVKVFYDDDKTVVYPAILLNNGETLAITDNVTVTGLSAGDTIILPTGQLTIAADGTVTGTSINVTDTTNDAADTVEVGEVYYYVDDTGTAGELTIAIEKDQDNDDDYYDLPGVLIIEEEDDVNAENAVFIATMDSGGSSATYVGYAAPVFTASVTYTESTSDDDVTAYLDYYGTYVERDTSDEDHDLVTVWYPDTQVYALVAIGEDPVWSTTGGTGETTYEEAVPIKDTIARLDTDPEVEAAKLNKNLILVGGPCVNKLTAEALGLPYPSCGAASTIPENAAMIKLVENAFGGGKVALVVAGWNAENTVAACKVLQQYDEYADLEGTAVKVTGTVTPTVSELEETAPAGNQTE